MAKEEFLQAVRYQNLREARKALAEASGDVEIGNIFDDGGEDPQGLLSVIPQDRIPEVVFYRLFGIKKGSMVTVERIPYSGFGPPAEEVDYMGFISEECAYVLEGEHFPIEISNCPLGARDIHHLEAMVREHQHPLDRSHLEKKLNLPQDWDFEELFELIAEGRLTGEEVDRLIHEETK